MVWLLLLLSLYPCTYANDGERKWENGRVVHLDRDAYIDHVSFDGYVPKDDFGHKSRNTELSLFDCFDFSGVRFSLDRRFEE